MEHSILEIVELDNGDVVLQHADGERKPLLNIQFSEESKVYMESFGRLKMLVAKAMIQAGVQPFSEYINEHADAAGPVAEDSPAILH